MIDANHSHMPNIAAKYVIQCKANIKHAIESNPLRPVLQVYEVEFKRTTEILSQIGDTDVLEEFMSVMPTCK